MKKIKYYLKLKNQPKGSRFIFFGYLEQHPYNGEWSMFADKWGYAKEFDTKEDALAYKEKYDDIDSFVVVDNLN